MANGEAAGEPIEVTDFFKLYLFCIFGRTAMGYDFGGIPPAGCPQQRRPSSSRECMPAEAVAFESLNADIGMRSTMPGALMNPSMQLYWIPIPEIVIDVVRLFFLRRRRLELPASIGNDTRRQA